MSGPIMHKVRVTILRRMEPHEVFEKLPATPRDPPAACELFEDGQVFISEPYGRIPEGFPCQNAWHTIYGTVRALAFGSDIPWYMEGNVSISCCSDGMRPVIFKLERSD